MSMNEKITQTRFEKSEEPPETKPFQKCKSATFLIDGHIYTIGNKIFIKFRLKLKCAMGKAAAGNSSSTERKTSIMY